MPRLIRDAQQKAAAARRSAATPADAAADLADAPGRALSAGISGAAGRKPASFLELCLDAGACGRGHAAADPALRLRCGDPVLRYPGGAACAGPAGAVSRRAADRCSSRSQPRIGTARTVARTLASAAGAGLSRRSRWSGASCRQTTALIGFAGAPWTVASYMIEGAAEQRFCEGQGLGLWRRPSFRALDRPAGRDATIDYLLAQIEAGAEALQLFDSWAGVLAEPRAAALVRSSRRRRSCARVKRRYPGCPDHRLSARRRQPLCAITPADAGCDALEPRQQPCRSTGRRDELAAEQGRVQGNLDPLLLVAGGVRHDARRSSGSSTRLGDGRFVFNLGHGILPETPPEHVARAAASIVHGIGDERVDHGARIAVVLFNLGGPDPAGRGRALPAQPVQRSGDHPPAAAAALAARAADRAAAGADRHARSMRKLGGGSPLLRQYRGPGARARARRSRDLGEVRGLHRACATGIR